MTTPLDVTAMTLGMGNASKYRSRSTDYEVWARRMNMPFTFKDADGLVTEGQPGDYLLCTIDGTEKWRVPEWLLKEYYARV